MLLETLRGRYSQGGYPGGQRQGARPERPEHPVPDPLYFNDRHQLRPELRRLEFRLLRLGPGEARALVIEVTALAPTLQQPADDIDRVEFSVGPTRAAVLDPVSDRPIRSPDDVGEIGLLDPHPLTSKPIFSSR